jgi:hypothetical protein
MGDGRLDRRIVLVGMAGAVLTPAAACAQSQGGYEMRVWRDASCGCCHTWTALMQRSGRFTPTLVDDADMAATKWRLGVPQDLASCHTALVDGYVIEGHVPSVDILHLLAERPNGVLGLAVPGMPIGSPGMEAPGGRRDAYEVIWFRRDGGRGVFARYAAA